MRFGALGFIETTSNEGFGLAVWDNSDAVNEIRATAAVTIDPFLTGNLTTMDGSAHGVTLFYRFATRVPEKFGAAV